MNLLWLFTDFLSIFSKGFTQELIRNLIDFLSKLGQDFIDFDWILLWLFIDFRFWKPEKYFIQNWPILLSLFIDSTPFHYFKCGPLLSGNWPIWARKWWKIADFLWILWPLTPNPLFQFVSTFREFYFGVRV